MLEVTIAGQTRLFLWSLALGGGLGFFYDVFRVLRIALPHRSIAVAFEDMFYWTCAAFVTFLFFFCADGGAIRLFLLMGEGIGFILYYFTLGALVIRAAKRIVAAIRWFLSKIYRIFIRPVVFFIGILRGFFSRMFRGAAGVLKKRLKNSNCHLKKHREILYNQRKHVKGCLPHKFWKRDRCGNEKAEATEKP